MPIKLKKCYFSLDVLNILIKIHLLNFLAYTWILNLGGILTLINFLRNIVKTFFFKYLSQFVSNKVLLLVYHGIIHSSIRQGIVAWGHCAYRHKIFALQRRAIRFVFNLSYRADCKIKFIECQVLILSSLYIYKCLLYAHKKQINFKRNKDISFK